MNFMTASNSLFDDEYKYRKEVIGAEASALRILP